MFSFRLKGDMRVFAVELFSQWYWCHLGFDWNCNSSE